MPKSTFVISVYFDEKPTFLQRTLKDFEFAELVVSSKASLNMVFVREAVMKKSSIYTFRKIVDFVEQQHLFRVVQCLQTILHQLHIPELPGGESRIVTETTTTPTTHAAIPKTTTSTTIPSTTTNATITTRTTSRKSEASNSSSSEVSLITTDLIQHALSHTTALPTNVSREFVDAYDFSADTPSRFLESLEFATTTVAKELPLIAHLGGVHDPGGNSPNKDPNL
ncbi:hypothetical protein Y032_0070g467 [Ancylostoma ceylanicum]|uniref:Uncharacterized protein n=1 Tax=Ancylostoma ceylanicum TaxID=53326 RepID=A0A016TXH5_9BILA|nr:hypothetical protein Y032_0070g467 [Ancylostoma ceylanicum]